MNIWTAETLALLQRPANTAVCCVQKQRLIQTVVICTAVNSLLITDWTLQPILRKDLQALPECEIQR